MNVACPDCATVFRVDPAKVPSGGVQARCSVCEGVMSVASPSEDSPAPVAKVKSPKAKAGGGAKTVDKKQINPFLSRDPAIRAKRLARALISDMVTYYPAKREEGLRNGTLKVLFKDEIQKSYEEYVGQVGSEFAESTTFFQDSLNELLASGKKVF